MKFIALFSALFLAAGLPAAAQAPVDASASASSTTVSRAEVGTVLQSLDAALGSYVFEDKVEGARKTLRAGRVRYLATRDAGALAAALTADLRAALGDKHFYVRAPGATSASPSPRDPAARAAAEARMAYGVERLRRLPGNVGYLDLRQFGMSPESGVRIDAAMDILADTDALIIDLRFNGGGGGEAMGVLFARLSAQPIARSIRIWRNEDGSFEREEPVTPERPADKRYARPVYLLTANRTFSAAETFAYDMQSSKRATTVGEATRGGANPMNRPLLELGSGFLAFVPNGRSENPITKGTANGTGVIPDVPTDPGAALLVAYRLALGGLVDDPSNADLTKAKADPGAALTGG